MGMVVETKFGFGDKVRDRVTKFEGMVTQYVGHMTGCAQYAVQPELDKEGKFVAPHYFDESRLDLVEEKVVTAADVTDPERLGADEFAPPSANAIRGKGVH